MSWTIAFAPLIPLSLLAVLGLAGFALAAFALACGACGAWLRAACVGGLAALLANPSLVQEDREPLADIAVLAVDRSASQAIGEREAVTEEARRLVQDRAEAMSGIDLRVVDVAGDHGDGGERGTRAFGDLSRALSDVPPERLAGIILLTDGQIHDVPQMPSGWASKRRFMCFLLAIPVRATAS